MSDKVITLGDNFNPPVINIEIAKEIYDCVRTDDFEVEIFNALLAAIITYCDTHNANYSGKDLPWAEEITEA